MSSLSFRASGVEIANNNVVVLLHGLFGSKGNLLSIGRVLSDQFHVLAVDLPGHGDSAAMQDMTFTNMANALQVFLEEQEIDQVHIVGHSLGGKVAMQFATLFPELTSSITVLDISPVTYKGRGHDPVFKAVNELDLENTQSRNDALSHFLDYTDDADTAKFILTNLRRTQAGYEWRIDFDILSDNYENLAHAPKLHHAYTGPALVLKGELSAYIQTKHKDVFMEYLPKATHITVAGAGHWLHAEKPREVQQHILKFLRKLI